MPRLTDAQAQPILKRLVASYIRKRGRTADNLGRLALSWIVYHGHAAAFRRWIA